MFFGYLRYLFQRKNEFHLHSPFVYALYTKVIKGKQDGALRDLGILEKKTLPVEALLDCYLAEREEDVMFVAEKIHENKQNETFWNTICIHPDVTLTIDLYHQGLVFFREGMEKQNFVL